MSVILHTETGSIYEVDQAAKRVRRMHGKLPATERQGADGEWKAFEKMFVTEAGAVFVWRYVDGIAKTTMTSPIVRAVKEGDSTCS